MPLGELIDVLKNNVEAASDQCDSLPSYTRSQDSTNRSNSLSESSGNQTVLSSAGIAGNPIVNFHIVIEEKLAIHARKRYEKQVMCFSFLSPFVLEYLILHLLYSSSIIDSETHSSYSPKFPFSRSS